MWHFAGIKVGGQGVGAHMGAIIRSFIELLPCTEHGARLWGYKNEDDTVSSFKEFSVKWRNRYRWKLQCSRVRVWAEAYLRSCSHTWWGKHSICNMLLITQFHRIQNNSEGFFLICLELFPARGTFWVIFLWSYQLSPQRDLRKVFSEAHTLGFYNRYENENSL